MPENDDFEMIPVASSNVASVGFEPSTGEGRVEYLSGALYSYDGCTAEEFNRIITAPSAGSMCRSLWGSKSFSRIG